MYEVITRLAGVTYGDAQKNINKFGWEDIPTYVLVREPDNSHDTNAINVSLFVLYHMGYVPRQIAIELAPMMDAGRDFIVEFVGRNESPYASVVGLTVRIIEENKSKGGDNYGK